MDMEGAIRLERPQEARVMIESILGLLDGLGASSPVILPFRDIRDGLTGSPTLDSLRIEADESLETLLDARGLQARYRFGKGSEAVRFAILSGNESFVTDNGIDYLDLGKTAELSPSASESLGRLVDVIADGDFSAQAQARMLTLIEAVIREAAL